MFIAKFPAIALFISFETFAEMVNKALEELEGLIAENSNIKDLIIKGSEDNNE